LDCMSSGGTRPTPKLADLLHYGFLIPGVFWTLNMYEPDDLTLFSDAYLSPPPPSGLGKLAAGAAEEAKSVVMSRRWLRASTLGLKMLAEAIVYPFIACASRAALSPQEVTWFDSSGSFMGVLRYQMQGIRALGVGALWDGVSFHCLNLLIAELAMSWVDKLTLKFSKTDQLLVKITGSALVSQIVFPLSQLSMLKRAETAQFLGNNYERVMSCSGPISCSSAGLDWGSLAGRINLKNYVQSVGVCTALVLLQVAMGYTFEEGENRDEDKDGSGSGSGFFDGSAIESESPNMHSVY